MEQRKPVEGPMGGIQDLSVPGIVTISTRRHAVTPPIHRLPPELLIIVFRLTLNLLYGFDDEGSLAEEAPLLLTRVCRRWRNLAEMTPSLWTHIHLRLRIADDYDLTPAVHHWAERAGVLPLHLTVGPWYEDEENFQNSQVDISRVVNWSQLRKYLPRFASLDLAGNQTLSFAMWSALFPPDTCIRMPLLRTLAVYLRAEAKRGETPFGKAIAPQLREITAGNLDVIIGTFGASLQHIENISLDDQHVMFRILEYCKGNLRRCSVSISDMSEYVSPWEINLPRLQRLNIWSMDTLLPRPFFDFIRPVSLERLAFRVSGTGAVDFASLPGALDTSKLQILILQCHAIGPDIIEALRACPNLNQLDLVFVQEGVRELVEWLTPSSEEAGAWICPRLQILTLHRCPLPVDDPVVLGLVGARERHGDTQRGTYPDLKISPRTRTREV
jgi:hypothetical protein